VSFSPPNAPPISAPLVPMFTFAIPQSLPRCDRKYSASRTCSVKIAEESPCGTSLWIRDRLLDLRHGLLRRSRFFEP
jgi:hypothetical protein